MNGPGNNLGLRGPGAVPVFFLLVAILLFVAGGGRPGSRLIGNADHPGLHGEMFHQQDFLDNVLAGRWDRPYFSRRIAQPHGEDLRPYVGISLHLFYYLPLAVFGNPVLRYNALMLLALALNGFCAYRLARHLTASTFAAVFAGLLFMFSPYALLKLETGFLQKTILWWIPLFLLEVIRFLDERTRRRAVLAGLYWALMLLTYAPYAVYGLAAAAIVVLGRVIRHPRDIPALAWKAAPALLPAGLALGLFVVAFPHGISFREGDIPQAILDAPLGSIDLRHPFRSLPYSGFIPMARTLPAGISGLGLILAVGALAGRRRHALLFAVVGGFFFLLSLGCHLHSLGPPFDAIPLPYYFLARYAPGGDRLGFPLRTLPYTDLALAMLAALAVAGAGRRIAARPRGIAVGCAAVLLLAAIAERRLLWPELFPVRSTAHVLSPEIQWLRDRGGVVLHLPYVPRGTDCRRYIYISAMSGTRMLNHYLEAPPGFPDIPRGPLPDRERILYLERLHRLGCDFIAVHPNLMAEAAPPLRTAGDPAPGPALLADDVDAIRRLCGPPAFAGGDVILHRVPPPAALDADARVSAAAVRARIGSHPGEARREPQIRVHRFAFPVPAGASAETRRAARGEADALARRLEADPDVTFAHAEELARSDPSRRWGDLGYLSRGTFPPEVEDPIFALTRPGQTAVVDQPGAILVFLVMDLRPGAGSSPDDAARAAADTVLRESRRLLAATGAHAEDDMILIPGGEFVAGSTEAEIDRAAAMASRFAGRIGPVDRRWFEDEPARRVSVNSFFIDRHEVTRGAYETFLKATGHRPLPGWAHEAAPDPSMPVVGVSWHDAMAYAAWAGKRLPTAEEWEWAARGPARRWFPWGDDEPDGSRGNHADASSGFPWCDERHDDAHPGLAPVGSYPAGATPEGILDMGGNAREWTATQRQGYVDPDTQHLWDFRQVPEVFPERTNAVPIAVVAVRGGAWRNAADDLRPSDERILPPDTVDPTQGFRCVRDVPAAGRAAAP